MGLVRTAWHIPFSALVVERAPRGIYVHVEFRLTKEPQRADLLLLRRAVAPYAVPHASMPASRATAPVFRQLWDRLGDDTIVEFKSLSCPFRRGDLVRLSGYGAQHHARNIRRLRRDALTLVLIVPSVSRTLLSEAASLGWTFSELGRGYHRIEGCVYSTYAIEIDEVAEAEQDDFLALFGARPTGNRAAFRWLERFVVAQTGKEETVIQKLEGYEDVYHRFLSMVPVKKRVASLTPEQRLSGLAPEQRLSGLAPEQILLSLPDEALRSLSASYLRTLPAATQRAITRRLGAKPRSRPRVRATSSPTPARRARTR